MKFWIKIPLFISAYSPLLLILALKNLDYHTLDFLICISLLLVANSIWAPIFVITKGWTNATFTVKTSINRSSDALDYIIAYVIAFLGFQFDTWQDIISIFVLFLVLFSVYVNSNLIFVNPLLNLMGYIIHHVEVEEGGSIVLLTKKFNLRKNERIIVKEMSDDIYLEVIS